MSTSIATLAEIASAKQFLRLIHAPTNIASLISAIVAWMRVVGSSWNPTTFAQRLLAGAVYVPTAFEKERDWVDPAHLASVQAYQLILAAARNGRGGDFLVALIMSGFDPTHYGPQTSKNKLLVTYSKITGLANPQLKQAAAKPVYVPPRPKYLAPPPRSRTATGFDSQGFYNARHKGGAIADLVSD